MKKFYMLFLIAAMLTRVALAQNLQWAKRMGGSGIDFGQAIAVDNSGNVYCTGFFANTADFDPGPGVFNLTAAGFSGVDIFIEKLDPSGAFLWAKRIGSNGDDRGFSIATDGTNVYVTGIFSLTVDFDPGAGVFNMTSAGAADVFVMKLDTSGNFIWATRMGGSGDDYGNSIALDASSNVYVTGYFNSNTNGIANLNSAGLADIFILKLTSAGSLVWSKQMGGTSLDEGNGITVSSAGNVYSTGIFVGTVDFDPGAGTFNLTATGGGPYGDIYVQELDASGNFVWAKQMGSTNDDWGYAITTDVAGNVYSTGYCTDTTNFFPDVFIQKLDAAGNSVWAKTIGSTLTDQGRSIDVDATGNVYTTGFFQNMVDFDPGPGVSNLTAAGSQDIFLLKLDASGNFAWALKFGAAINDNGYASVTTVGGNVYVSGTFGQTVDFDPGPGVFNLTAAGGSDVFVLKLNEPQALPVELVSFIAVAMDNNKVKLDWTTASEINNNYFTVERSKDALNWEPVTRINGNGNSNAALEYEAWDDVPLNGTSYYHLRQADFDGTFSYSPVVAINLAGSAEIILSNPVTNELVIRSSEFPAQPPGGGDNNELIIYNMVGEKIFNRELTAGSPPQIVMDISGWNAGTYFVSLKTASGIISGKFVKE